MEFEIYAYREHSQWTHIPITGGLIVDVVDGNNEYYWAKSPPYTLMSYSTVNTWPIPGWYPNVIENGEFWFIWASTEHSLEQISPASKIFFERELT